MADPEKILERARRSPSSLRFAELCQLAEAYGFEFARQRGSHRVYKRPGERGLMNFQERRGGQAVEYQVRQLLSWIDEHSDH